MDGWFATMVTGNMNIRTALNNYFHYIFTCSVIDCLVYKMSEGVKKIPITISHNSKCHLEMTCYFLNNTEYNGRYVNLSLWSTDSCFFTTNLAGTYVHIYTYLFNPHAALCFHHPTDWLVFPALVCWNLQLQFTSQTKAILWSEKFGLNGQFS